MSLNHVLNAESVAIIGASKSPTKRGFQTIRTLMEENYRGLIYPVNPKEKHILGHRCYRSVAEIDGPVDMALIATPAQTVPAIIEECGQKGIKGAVVLAGGFGELGEVGKTLEDRVVAAARQYSMRIIGPNTSGMINCKSNLNLVGLRDVPKGEIALLTQSGNMALSLITEAKVKSRKGFTYYVGVGNEAEIRFHEYLSFFTDDPDTKAILMYVEGMRQGREFLHQAYKTSLKKPIIMLKSGRSLTGKRSAGSHTGALAGISEVARGAFERAGVIMIENSDELFPAVETLSSLPPIKNNAVAILADGGGHATIAADILTDLGLEIPLLSEKTQIALQKILPSAASVRNPVDVAGGTDTDPRVFAECARIMLRDVQIGGLLIVGLFGGYGIRFTESLAFIEEDAAHMMGKLVQRKKKPIVLHSLYASSRAHSLELMQYYGIPVYDSLDIASKCIGVLAQYGEYLKSYHTKHNFRMRWGHKRKPEGDQIFQTAVKEKRQVLMEHEAKKLFRIYGAPVSRDMFATTVDEAVEIARKIDGEVALKIVSPDILHKSDAGGVRVKLKGDDQVRSAFETIMTNAMQYDPSADIRGVLVSPMAHTGIEVIIGAKIDDQFGHVIMYGLGGVMVEVLKDVAFRVLPLTPTGARKMIRETKSYPILEGVRGRLPYDQKALQKLLVLCSDIIEAYPEIAEMDLNPVILHHTGLSIVDARILLRDVSDDKNGF